jgi:futalosine hydrolase
MFLIVAATEMEMRPFKRAGGDVGHELLVTGMGLMETTFSLTRRLARGIDGLEGVIHFGVAGAYLYEDGSGAEMLDICMAEEEVLGDFGICLPEKIERFVASAPELGVRDRFFLDKKLLIRASEALLDRNIKSRKGVFVTVNSVSGSKLRGDMFVGELGGLCENMEGAAVVRVCDGFSLPCLEIRCVSNVVEDRNAGNWQLKNACRLAGEAAAVVVRAFGDE